MDGGTFYFYSLGVLLWTLRRCYLYRRMMIMFMAIRHSMRVTAAGYRTCCVIWARDWPTCAGVTDLGGADGLKQRAFGDTDDTVTIVDLRLRYQ